MRNVKLIGLAVAILAAIGFVGAYAQDTDAKKTPPANGKPDQAQMMQAFMQAAAPGPHHKNLERMAGKFKFVNKFKMDPSQEWQTSEGDYEGEMCMDGRFLLSNIKGNMMGMPFQGMGCMGYDNVAKKHVAAWIDNMGTGIMYSEGTCDGSCNTITFQGEMLCPIEHTNKAYRYTYEIKGNDEFVMRWWSPSPADGKLFESMVITYTRAN